MCLDPALQQLLTCPRCRGKLVLLPAALGCPACRLAYPVADGIPVMISEEAAPWTPDAGERPRLS